MCTRQRGVVMHRTGRVEHTCTYSTMGHRCVEMDALTTLHKLRAPARASDNELLLLMYTWLNTHNSMYCYVHVHVHAPPHSVLKITNGLFVNVSETHPPLNRQTTFLLNVCIHSTIQ